MFDKSLLEELYYQQRLSTREISDLLSVHYNTIIYQMERYDLARRNRHDAKRRQAINEAAFDPPLTDEQAYWLGFLMADGWTDGQRALRLRLQAADYEQVAAFARFLDSTCPPKPGQTSLGHATFGLQISSQRLVQAAMAYGIVPRKSFTASAPAELQRNSHYWRGVVDGDGTLGWMENGKYPRLALVGAYSLVSQFAVYCQSLTATRANVNSLRNIYQFSLAGRHAVSVVAALYGPSSGPVLARKRIIADDILKRFKL